MIWVAGEFLLVLDMQILYFTYIDPKNMSVLSTFSLSVSQSLVLSQYF